MSALPEPWRDLMREIGKIKEQLRRLSNRSPFFGTGVHTNGLGGLDSDNYVPATSGFSLKGSTGVAEFKDIILYDLPNSMLANPTAPASVFDYVQNFALSTTLTNIKTTTVPVPAGFTKAAVSIVVRVFAINPNTSGGYDGAGGDYLYGQANINGSNGFALPLAVSGSGGSGTNNSPFSKIVTGLNPGDSISLQIAASTAFASWAANSANVAEVSGSISWYR